MKKCIFVGPSQAGKTSLIQALNDQALTYKKTQEVIHAATTIDTPGEYVERRFFYAALVSSAQDADLVAFVHHCNASQGFYSPAFACGFNRPVIGILTKVDLAENEEQIERAKKHLQQAGATQIFMTSSVDRTGIEELRAFLEE